jgi:hypothetical protein
MPMKKLLLFLFFINVLTANGQNYIRLLGDTTVWNIQENVFALIHERSFTIWPGDYQATGDTMISGINYKSFYQEWYPNGFIREDTAARKVWFLEDTASQELLLYDFSLNQNDSVLLTFPNYVSGDAFPSGYYHIDSIITRNIISGPRKFYYLSNPASPFNPMDNGNRFYLIWIEGIGSTIHPAYIYLQEFGQPAGGGPLTWPCGAYHNMALACSYQDGVHEFFEDCFWSNNSQYALDSCHYQFPGGIDEQNNSFALTLSPNPATNKITIYDLRFTISKIEIYNVLGKNVYQCESAKTEIDVSNLLPGIYFVKVITDKTNFAGKFVKE